MKVLSALLALVLAVPALAASQERELASDLTGYTRFVVYPHLQRGWESMQRGDRDRALMELEQAHRLAPESASVSLHLAAAYRTFGETARAESVLREQLKRSPDHAQLRAALTDLRAKVQRPAPVPAAGSCTEPRSASCRDVAAVEGPRAGGASVAKPPVNGAGSASAQAKAARRPPPVRPDPIGHEATSGVTPPAVPPDPLAAITVALDARRFDAAEQQAESLLAQNPARGGLFDEVTYKLVDAGATEQATRILLRAYPFAAAAPADRERLFERLGLLVEQQRTVLPTQQLRPLRDPLDNPGLRSRQAALWASLQDCGAVRAVLGDLSPAYGYDDWMRLGDCSIVAAPALAEQAYGRAHALQPGGRGSRAVAYSAYASGDYRAALDAWRTVATEHLSGADLIAAVTTALAAGDRDQAAAWLGRYRERGDTLDYRYWSLLGQSYAVGDAAAAVDALERAVARHPDVDDYLRLARLDRTPGRAVQWLERAADLDRASAAIQLQLAYAYTHDGRATAALSALERAAALDPDNMNVQVELGYAHWRAGHPALAKRALERAWRADPTRLVLAQDLVYISQRLKQNDTARWFAEQVLDAPSAFSDAATNEHAATADEHRFAFQRLHEDLGRRVTINLDGFSGTRVGTTTNASPAGSHYRSFSQLEADVRLGNPPVRDGSTLSAYARLLGDSGEQHSALPSEDALAGFGLRWKPWRRQVIYLAAENQIGLEDRSRRDVLLRASASFFNGGRFGDDWHPSRQGWMSRNLYLDAAHYLKTDYSAFTADYRMSYHRTISTEQTVEPYGHVQFTGARDGRINRDVRGGLGLRWNLWYGATTYDAVPHKLSLGVEFQQAVETYLPDRNGVFVTLGTRW